MPKPFPRLIEAYVFEPERKPLVGEKIAIYWKRQKQYFVGKVAAKVEDARFLINYEDGDVEIVDLDNDTWEFATDPSRYRRVPVQDPDPVSDVEMTEEVTPSDNAGEQDDSAERLNERERRSLAAQLASATLEAAQARQAHLRQMVSMRDSSTAAHSQDVLQLDEARMEPVPSISSPDPSVEQQLSTRAPPSERAHRSTKNTFPTRRPKSTRKKKSKKAAISQETNAVEQDNEVRSTDNRDASPNSTRTINAPSQVFAQENLPNSTSTEQPVGPETRSRKRRLQVPTSPYLRSQRQIKAPLSSARPEERSPTRSQAQMLLDLGLPR